MIAPIRRIPKNGYNSTGLVPSSACGRRSNAFFKSNIKYPATNPAINAPKNPDEIHWSSGRNTDVPAFASNPPTIPGIKAGRSAMLIAMYPARIGNIIPNAVSPTVFKNLENVFPVPKISVPAFAPSNRNAKAIKIPPPITNGNIWETPFIKFL